MCTYLHYPISKSFSLIDASWRVYAKYVPIYHSSMIISLFEVCSIPCHIISFHELIHKQNDPKTITTQRSTKANIYLALKCTKELLCIKYNDFVPKLIKYTQTIVCCPHLTVPYTLKWEIQ